MVQALPQRRKQVVGGTTVEPTGDRGHLRPLVFPQPGKSTNLTQCALESHADGNQKLFPCEVCGRCFAADVLVNIKTFSRCVSLESNELSSQRGGNGAKIKDRCGVGREETYVTYGCQAWRTLRQADNATFRSDPINRGLPERMPIGMVLAQAALS